MRKRWDWGEQKTMEVQSGRGKRESETESVPCDEHDTTRSSTFETVLADAHDIVFTDIYP